jgi:hypothetical protein
MEGFAGVGSVMGVVVGGAGADGIEGGVNLGRLTTSCGGLMGNRWPRLRFGAGTSARRAKKKKKTVFKCSQLQISSRFCSVISIFC